VALDVRWSVAAKDDSIDARLVDRVLGGYREVLGLALTIEQAPRLSGCDAVTCQRIVDVLRRALCAGMDARQAPDSSGVGVPDCDENPE
jgi:hypothetical protein